jgi:transmembrane protein EpsG
MTGGAIWLVNGIRQFFAVTLILFFSDWIIKRKTIAFFIVVFFAYYIHSASLLWIPIYFIVAFKPWSSKFIISVVAFVIGMILLSRSSLLGSTDFSYLSTESYEGINPFRIAVFSVPAVIAFVRRDEIKSQKNVFLDLLVNFSVICSACYIVGWFSNGIIARIAMYFTPFIYVLLPLVLKKTFDEGMGKTIFIISVVGFLAYFCFEMYIAKNGVYYSEILGLNFWNL